MPDNKIIEAHGSFAHQRCIECKNPYPDDLMKKAIKDREVPHCLAPQCSGLVKPDIVFFGEALPEEFTRSRNIPANADLCIVMGTSLTVQPFASLPDFCAEDTPRLLINLERVGTLGSRRDDVLLLGDCDAGIRKLALALGWLEELNRLWKQTNPDFPEDEEKTEPNKTKDEALEDEIDTLTKEVDKSLKLSSDHTSWLRDHLTEKNGIERHTNEQAERDIDASTTDTIRDVEASKAESNTAPSSSSAEDEWSTEDETTTLSHVLPQIEKKVER